MKKHTFEVSKSSQVYTKGVLDKNTKQVWLFLHGYGQLAESFLEEFGSIADDATFLISPEALSKFYNKGVQGNVGASWMTSENRIEEINDYVQYLDQVLAHFLPEKFPDFNFHVLGFSQGASTASHWVEQSEKRTLARSITFWSGSPSLDFQKSLQEDRFQSINFQFVYGKQDPFINQDLVNNITKLVTEKSNISLSTFEGKHEINPTLLVQLKNQV